LRPSRTYRSVRAAFVGLAVLFFGLPFYWAAVLAFADSAAAVAGSWGSLYPHRLSLRSFDVLSEFDLPITNSLIVAGATALLSTALAVGAGYALSRNRFGQGLLLVTMLVVRIVPPVALMIPIFIVAVRLHLRDSVVGLVLVYTALSLPFSMWLIFVGMRAIPAEIEEAARMDGCTRLQAASLMARLALPAMLAAAMFAFVLAWAEFTVALLLTDSKAITLPVALSFGRSPGEDSYVALLVLVSAIPGLVLALLIGRSLQAGTIVGSRNA
jgi:ABC-type glycerol-3-phosphate transport system permease component